MLNCNRIGVKCWLLLLTISLTACSFWRDEKSYVKDMMISNECTNACWLGIEPGMRIEPNRAFEILSNHYGRENVHYLEGSDVGWYMDASPVFSEKGYIGYTEDNQVGLITIIFQNNQVPVDDLVAVYGKPEIAIIRNKKEEGFPSCGLWQLAYPQIGLSVIIDGTQGAEYVGMMYIDKPYPASDMQVSKEREAATKESIINWDERDKYCTHTTPSSP